ncbi:DUF4190 domain-containing protein [Streptomyces bambusae]
MSDHHQGPAQEPPRDPWAAPEPPAVRLGKEAGGAAPPAGPYGAPVPPVPPANPYAGPGPVHEQPTMAGVPGPEVPPNFVPAYPVAQPEPYGVPGYGYPGGVPYQGQPYAGQPYGGQPYGGPQPGWGAAPDNTLGTVALVLGILSVCIFCTSLLAVVLGISAVVCGAVASGRVKRGRATNGGQALAGIILGSIGTLLGLVLVGFVVWGIANGETGGGDPEDLPEPLEITQVHHRGAV